MICLRSCIAFMSVGVLRFAMDKPRTKARTKEVMIGKTGFIVMVKIGSKLLPSIALLPMACIRRGSRVLPRKYAAKPAMMVDP